MAGGGGGGGAGGKADSENGTARDARRVRRTHYGASRPLGCWRCRAAAAACGNGIRCLFLQLVVRTGMRSVRTHTASARRLPIPRPLPKLTSAPQTPSAPIPPAPTSNMLQRQIVPVSHACCIPGRPACARGQTKHSPSHGRAAGVSCRLERALGRSVPQGAAAHACSTSPPAAPKTCETDRPSSSSARHAACSPAQRSGV